MNRFRPFHSAATNDEIPAEYQQVRFIREACKAFADVFKAEKDFLSKNVDNEMTKIFADYRSSETGRPVRSPSILADTMDEILQLNRNIDLIRRDSFDRTRKLAEEAKGRQATIRQTISDHREQFEKAKRKSESAESNRKKFVAMVEAEKERKGFTPRLSTMFERDDHRSKLNNEDKLAELDGECIQCKMNQSNAHDQYLTSVYRVAADEYAISRDYFLQYVKVQGEFYRQVSQIFQEEISQLEGKYSSYPLAPLFQCDLSEHCLKRVPSPIAYPLEVTIQLLRDSVEEDGLFRQAPSILKQKRFAAQLDLQLFNRERPSEQIPIVEPHVVASVLKQYLRELPDPLLTNALFPYWNQIGTLTTDEQRFQLISALIRRLPEVNYNNLRYLVEFLTRVAKCKEKNRMTANNLGICIGSSLLTSKENPSESASPSSYTTAGVIVEVLITHFDLLFCKDGQAQLDLAGRSPPDLLTSARTSTRSSSSQLSEDLLLLPVSSQSTPLKPRKTRTAPQPPPPLVRSRSTAPVGEGDEHKPLSKRSESLDKGLDDELFADERFQPSDSGLSRSSDNDMLISFDDSSSSNVSNEERETRGKLTVDDPTPSNETKQRTSLRRGLVPPHVDDGPWKTQYEETRF